MFGDRERPARIDAEQDRAVRRYIRREVYPYSDALRRRLDAAGITPGRVRSRADLAQLPLVELDTIPDPVPWILRPDALRIHAHGDRLTRTRLLLAGALGRQAAFAHGRLDPLYKPVHWAQAGDDRLLLASSSADLERLGELGRRWLETAGVRPHDVVVSLVPPGPTVAFWQLALGARRAGLSALFLDAPPTPARAEYLRPTVLVGPADALATLARDAVAAGHDLGSVRVAIVVGGTEPPDGTSATALARLLPGASVVAAWAPPGVRAVWTQCEGGRGFHTWPATELIELIDPPTGQPVAPGRIGEVVWSALGWRGTVLLRLRTRVLAVERVGACPACGRTTPRLEPLSFPAVLDAHPAVAAWQAEVRHGPEGDEVVVFAALARADGAALDGDLPATVRELDAGIGAAQFVVLDRPALDKRVRAHAGAQVVDLG